MLRQDIGVDLVSREGVFLRRFPYLSATGWLRMAVDGPVIAVSNTAPYLGEGKGTDPRGYAAVLTDADFLTPPPQQCDAAVSEVCEQATAPSDSVLGKKSTPISIALPPARVPGLTFRAVGTSLEGGVATKKSRGKLKESTETVVNLRLTRRAWKALKETPSLVVVATVEIRSRSSVVGRVVRTVRVLRF
jgi:hypothetical protein